MPSARGARVENSFARSLAGRSWRGLHFVRTRFFTRLIAAARFCLPRMWAMLWRRLSVNLCNKVAIGSLSSRLFRNAVIASYCFILDGSERPGRFRRLGFPIAQSELGSGAAWAGGLLCIASCEGGELMRRKRASAQLTGFPSDTASASVAFLLFIKPGWIAWPVLAPVVQATSPAASCRGSPK